MNIYSWIILTTLLLNFLINTVSEVLNLGCLGGELPEEFSAIYDQEAYANSQAYARARASVGFVAAPMELGALLLFWFLGGFNLLDLWVRGLGLGALATGLLYIALLLVLKYLLSLPFTIYTTFVIEERFGFNRTTPGLFVLDQLKGLILAVLLGGLLLSAILALFEWGGPGAWLPCWLAASTFLLFVQFIAPTWIMPMFNSFEPLEDGELRRRIEAYARSVNFSLDNILVMDGSKRSSKSNAFFTGFGSQKRICLFDTLIANHSVDELVAILAHEIGHYKLKHMIKGLVLSIIHMGVMLGLLSLFLGSQGLFAAFFMEQRAVYSGLVFFGLLLTPLDMVLGVLLNMFSRANEYQADRFAVRTSQLGEAMIMALKKLSLNNLANLTPHPLNVFLHYSHPPLMERIRAIRTYKETER